MSALNELRHNSVFNLRFQSQLHYTVNANAQFSRNFYQNLNGFSYDHPKPSLHPPTRRLMSQNHRPSIQHLSRHRLDRRHGLLVQARLLFALPLKAQSLSQTTSFLGLQDRGACRPETRVSAQGNRRQ